MARVLHPLPRRRMRLGDADRDDQDLSAVGTVRRLDHETTPVLTLVESSRGPSAAVTYGDAAPLGEGRDVRLHLRP